MGVDIAGREDAFAAANGYAHADSGLSDTAIWNFCNCGSEAIKGNPLAFIHGDTSPEAIGTRDGIQVMLLLPVTIRRSWNGRFYAPQLQQWPPSVKIIEQLSPAQAAPWISRATEG